MPAAEVVAVIVAFEPDLERLGSALEPLARTTRRVVLADNSESAGTRERLRALCVELGVAYVGGNGNLGIATAQNAALGVLEDEPDAVRVVFLDQDSVVPDTFIRDLSTSYSRLRELDASAGVLGATPVDSEGRAYLVKALGNLEGYQRVDFVISSGSMLSLGDLRDVGGLRDDLFVDLVDNDLCWRLRRRGRESYLDGALTFEHRVGTGAMVSAFGRSAPVSAPVRNYFQVRNLILLGRAGTLSWWRVARGLVMRFGVVVLSVLRTGQARLRLGHALRGFRDGVLGRGGPFPASRRESRLNPDASGPASRP